MKRKALGRGLSALLSDLPEEVAPEKPYQELPVDRIDENEFQPRQAFDDAGLDGLAQSIKLHGVLQPVLVRQSPVNPDRFELIAGERRLRACRMAGLERIPAVLVAAEDLQSLELALVENLQRADLNPIDESLAYEHLVKSFHLTQDTVAQRVGKSREAVANSLRLLTLPEEVQEMVRSGALSAGHARALVGVSPSTRLLSLARKIVSDKLSVRDAERLVSSGKPRKQSTQRSERSSDPYLDNLEALFQDRLQTRVRIVRSKSGKGKIEIEFYDNTQLNSLMERLQISPDG